MAFPQTPVELLAEMQIGGTWTDITADLYARGPLTIERGRPDEATRVDPSKATFELDNRQNKYSPRNPRSVNYGMIGRNTPVRFSVPGTESYLATTGVSGDIVATPDHASLDIVGDLDVRIEATADWVSGTQQTLIGKWPSTDGQRSWNLRVVLGLGILVWTPTGNFADAIAATIPLPQLPRRAALRSTLDVNNGAGGWTSTLYWAETLDGPWTTIGTATGTGVTSIHSGTAPLEIAPTHINGTEQRNPWRGRLHRAEVRSGIGGSVVASPDVRALAPGTTSWADSAGRTWTVAGAAAITNREYRLHAEVASWPPRWDVSGEDVYVPVEAAGILRRLGQGSKALASTLRRRLPSNNPVAYWPMEDGSDATQAYSPIPGCPPLRVADFTFAADSSCPGSSALPTIGAAATMHAAVPPYTNLTGGYLVAMLYSIDSMPASKSGWLSIQTTGTGSGIVMSFTSTVVVCDVYDDTGTLIDTESFSNSSVFGPDKWFRFDLTAQAAGLDTDYHLGFVDVDGGGVQWNFTVSSAAPGTVTDIDTGFGTLLSGMAIGHLGVYPSSDVGIWGPADNGYRGENASDRLVRLGGEESVPITAGYAPTQLGAQRPATLLALFAECEAADGGVLYEDRDRLALRYRARQSLYNQPIALTLDYTVDGHVAPPLEPVDDDQRVRNDRTITRAGGSSARAVDETSALSIQPPPLGVGVYDDTTTLNLFTDDQPAQIATWALHLGTWDEARYPTVHINLAAAPSLIPDVLALDIGDRIQIINPPDWLPPGPIDLIVEGYTEVIGHPNDWDIVLSCSPAGPWTVGILDDDDLGRLDTDGSELASGVTSSATSLSVATTSGPIWTTAAGDMPFDIRVDGEVMTVTAVSGAASPQTFTIGARSVNGIVKAHSSGADVCLATPTILAL